MVVKVGISQIKKKKSCIIQEITKILEAIQFTYLLFQNISKVPVTEF